jgi:phospholipid/cholesterol/gamma-HCH transport system substrate-binding protein
MNRRNWLTATIATFIVVVAAACTALTGSNSLTVTAVFDDVADLVTQAHVRAGDVPIGTIQAIELTQDGTQAVVTMSIESDTRLPGADQVTAVLSRTSLLGERFVDLRSPEDGGTGQLQDGDRITNTLETSDVEQLVSTGDALLSITLVGNVAVALQSGSEALGGQGANLRSLIDNLRNVIGRYNDGSDDLVRVIDAFDEFAATLAPEAELNARGLETLDEASRVLQREDEDLLDALDDIRRLAEVGARVLDDNADEFDNAFRRLRILLEEINRSDSNIQDLLTWVRRHNAHVANGAFTFDDGTQIIDHAQVWLDFIICGLPGGEVEGDPAADCEPPTLPGPGAPATRYPTHPACWDGDFAQCRQDVEGHR